MRHAARLLFLTITAAVSLAAAEPSKSWARGLAGGPSFWLSCENGAEYGIRPLAVSDEGDMVAGQLIFRQRQGMHIRLVPMGFGYRYAGRGVWFDGERENVYLYFSKYRPIACTIVRGPERVRG